MARRNVVLRSQARQMVYDVMMFMQNEADKGLMIDLKAAQKRTAAATGVSIATVSSISKAASAPGASLHDVFRTPGKKTVRRRVRAFDSVQRGIMKRCIHNFHNTEKELPTINRLFKKFKELVNFQGASSSLEILLKDMGFKWRKTDDKHKVLIERSHIRLKRIEYLQHIIKSREEGRSIVHIDSTYIDTINKKGDGLIVVHAATDTGFLPHAFYIFRAGTKADDNRHYDIWLRTKLIPNLPESSVVVVGKTPYFHKLEVKIPTSTSKRCEMETWLFENGIPFIPDTNKPLLYKTIIAYKDCYKKYKIDSILGEKNHPVLRFPVHHIDLNPLEMAWTALKRHVNENKTKSINAVKKIIHLKIQSMNEEFSTICQQLKGLENEYIRNDMVVDKLTDDVTILVRDNESDDDSDDESASEEDQCDESESSSDSSSEDESDEE